MENFRYIEADRSHCQLYAELYCPGRKIMGGGGGNKAKVGQWLMGAPPLPSLDKAR